MKRVNFLQISYHGTSLELCIRDKNRNFPRIFFSHASFKVGYESESEIDQVMTVLITKNVLSISNRRRTVISDCIVI